MLFLEATQAVFIGAFAQITLCMTTIILKSPEGKWACKYADTFNSLLKFSLKSVCQFLHFVNESVNKFANLDAIYLLIILLE